MTTTKKESLRQSYWLAFGIPVGLMLIVMLISGSEPFGGDVSMLYSDMYHQYFPFWVEFGRALREAAANGVQVIAMDCAVDVDSMEVRLPVLVKL